MLLIGSWYVMVMIVMMIRPLVLSVNSVVNLVIRTGMHRRMMLMLCARMSTGIIFSLDKWHSIDQPTKNKVLVLMMLMNDLLSD